MPNPKTSQIFILILKFIFVIFQFMNKGDSLENSGRKRKYLVVAISTIKMVNFLISKYSILFDEKSVMMVVFNPHLARKNRLGLEKICDLILFLYF